ncbi:50S ribosomal protein L20 [endosymbiont GvMRE of Glomus versiforme]|uniref:50S ribosomal protein L20 n=1 Tax=endosymbiont GvMRE of Glomus versiforme TaxID=2039283 RepID=UPI000EC2F6CC|nr:50S ribosomal protein L20 [endosymbiont GvMRE of Glomus versiforme]RHZ36340.1 50S ribosomal protein L20 [endosymbiont GvMRE of Glomus versiforme]
MTRAKNTPVTRERRKKILKQAKGFYGSKHKLFKTAKEQLMHAWEDAYIGRKQRKRFFHRIWILRLNIFCRARGLKYSSLIRSLKLAKIELDPKQLSEMAIHQPELLNKIIDTSIK